MTDIPVWAIEKLLAGQAPRTNINVFDVDGAYTLRVAKLGGEFPWHRHPRQDEAWLVWKGRLRLDFDNRDPVELSAGEMARVPAGVVHRPVALADDTLAVFVNARDFEMVFLDEDPDLGTYSLRGVSESGGAAR